MDFELRPSASSRWLECQQSVWFSNEYESESSKAAEYGTKLHELAADELTIGERMHAGDETGEFMIASYVAYVKGFDQHQRHIEKELQWPGIPELKGTPDVVLVAPGEIRVVDLKTGRYPVKAEKNTQLLTYLAMAVTQYHAQGYRMYIDIVQPMVGGVESYRVTAEELDAYKWKVGSTLRALRIAWKNEKLRAAPSESNCKWCPGNGRCTAQTQNLLAEFGDMKPTYEMDPKDIANLLTRAKELVQWADGVERWALEHAIATGEVPPGYKIGQKTTMRKWTNESMVVEILRDAGYSNEEIFTRKIISPAKAEAMVLEPKQLEKFIVKPEGAPVLKKA